MTRFTGMAVAAVLLPAMLAAAGCRFTGTVEVGEESWEAVFEDSSIDEAEAREIFGDYRIWVNRHGRIWRDPRWAEKPGEERRGKNGKLALTGCLTMPSELCGHFVDGITGNREQNRELARELREQIRQLSDEFGWLVACDDGQERLVVPQAVSDACREALALWQKHPGARDKLEELVRILNADDPSLWPEAPLDFLFLYDYNEHQTARFCKDYERLRNGEMSRENDLTGRYDWSVGPLITAGMFEGHLTVCVVITRRHKRYSWESDCYPWPFIYDDGHWKMFYCKGMEGC